MARRHSDVQVSQCPSPLIVLYTSIDVLRLYLVGIQWPDYFRSRQKRWILFALDILTGIQRAHLSLLLLFSSYHGWRFDGDGNCVKLPQAASEDAEKRATCSPRACAASHPLAEAQGLIFVWSESGSQAQEEAERTPLPLDPLLAAAEERGDDIKAVIPLFFRDLPYDFETLVENVIDPAHAPFSHHGIQGDRNSVKYGDYELKARKSKGCLSVDMDLFGRNGTLSFTPPSVVQITSINADVST